MSADNYFLIRVHPNGGFAAVMGFASDENVPEARPDHEQYSTIEAALFAADDEYSEYGVSVHEECRNAPLTPDGFMARMLSAFPLAVAETDNDGQLIIYTNLVERDGFVVSMDDPNMTGV